MRTIVFPGRQGNRRKNVRGMGKGASLRFGGGFGSRGKLDGEYRAALRRARRTNLAAVFAHDAEHDGKSETSAHARRLGGEKGIEDARQYRLGNARTVVGD